MGVLPCWQPGPAPCWQVAEMAACQEEMLRRKPHRGNRGRPGDTPALPPPGPRHDRPAISPALCALVRCELAWLLGPPEKWKSDVITDLHRPVTLAVRHHGGIPHDLPGVVSRPGDLPGHLLRRLLPDR